MENKNKWIIGIDLDRTLLRGFEFGEHKKVSPFTRNVLHAMHEQGHIVCIDTGRTFFAARDVYESIGLDSIIINHAGAYIHNPNDDNFKSIKKYLDQKQLLKILFDDKYSDRISSRFIDCYDVTHSYDEDGKITNMLTDLGMRNFSDKSESIENASMKALSANVAFNIEENEFDELLKHFEEEYKDYFNIVDWSWKDAENFILGIEINVKNAAKGQSLLQLAEMLDIPKENTMGIGDSENDRDLMVSPCLGVAMKNATPEIKELANLILDKDFEEEAVAHFLNDKFKLGL